MDRYDKEGTKLWRSAELANSVNFMHENKIQMLRLIQINAQLRYQKYNSLIKAGFSEEQALSIVINTVIMG